MRFTSCDGGADVAGTVTGADSLLAASSVGLLSGLAADGREVACAWLYPREVDAVEELKLECITRLKSRCAFCATSHAERSKKLRTRV